MDTLEVRFPQKRLNARRANLSGMVRGGAARRGTVYGLLPKTLERSRRCSILCSNKL